MPRLCTATDWAQLGGRNVYPSFVHVKTKVSVVTMCELQSTWGLIDLGDGNKVSRVVLLLRLGLRSRATTVSRFDGAPARRDSESDWADQGPKN
jgi:hypothetical protein